MRHELSSDDKARIVIAMLDQLDVIYSQLSDYDCDALIAMLARQTNRQLLRAYSNVADVQRSVLRTALQRDHALAETMIDDVIDDSDTSSVEQRIIASLKSMSDRLDVLLDIDDLDIAHYLRERYSDEERAAMIRNYSQALHYLQDDRERRVH